MLLKTKIRGENLLWLLWYIVGMVPETKSLISWEAEEYTYTPKTKDWYWVVFILTFGLVVVAYFLNNFLFGVFVLIAGFTVALYGAKRPRTVRFAVLAQGIQVDKKIYTFRSLKSFWIHYDPPHKKEVSLVSKKLLVPRITLPLGDTDPNQVREVLIKFLREREHHESLVENLAKYLNF